MLYRAGGTSNIAGTARAASFIEPPHSNLPRDSARFPAGCYLVAPMIRIARGALPIARRNILEKALGLE